MSDPTSPGAPVAQQARPAPAPQAGGPTPPPPPVPPPVAEGPGASPASKREVALTAAYLALVAALALHLVAALWPYPTPSGELPARGNGATAADGTTRVEKPTLRQIADRQDRLCGKLPRQASTARQGLLRCRACVRQEMELQNESQRSGDPRCARILGGHWIVWQEERLLLLVLVAGAVGALLHAVRSLVAYVGNRRFVASWIPYYYLAPLSGAMVAFVTYITIRGGFFSADASTADSNPFMFVALATLSGLFSAEVLEKLRKVAETAFEEVPPGRNALASPKPVVSGLVPDHVAVGFAGTVAVSGSGFADDAKVEVDGAPTPTTRGDAEHLTFDLPATATVKPGSLRVVVLNPPPGGGRSAGDILEVRPADGGGG